MRIARWVAPSLLLTLLPTVGFRPQYDYDPPTRVARLSYLDGPASLRPGGVEEWTDATVNYPLTAGDDIWTDAARMEITIGSAAIRLAPNSAFGFLALDDYTTQVRLSDGAVQIRLRDLDSDEVFEIDTPNGAVTLYQPGTYRIDVESSGNETRLTVRRGQAELAAAGSAIDVNSGETATLRGEYSPRYDLYSADRPDSWERWCLDRDRRRDRARSVQYVSPYMPGYEDLDDYGVWRVTAEYGAVWVPRGRVVNWAPYRDGRWVWIDPWGWTWVDNAPWGFAPFHYGRWVFLRDGWAWVPGHVVARPVYAPALVVFLGGGTWSVAVRRTVGVAWFPLGPGEVYVPTYRVSQRYVRSVNSSSVNAGDITYGRTTNVRYRNREAPGSVTIVTRETFVSAGSVRRNMVVVSQDQLRTAPVAGSAAPFAPTRGSVAPRTGRPVNEPPPDVVRRRVVVRTTPPPAPVPFSARERVLQSQPGRPLDQDAVESLRGRGTGRDYGRYTTPATASQGNELRPARRGLPAPRAVTPGKPQQGRSDDQDRGRGHEERGRRQPQPPAEQPRTSQPAPTPPAPPLPTPPRLPNDEPQPPPTPPKPPTPPTPPATEPSRRGKPQPEQPVQPQGSDTTTKRRRP